MEITVDLIESLEEAVNERALTHARRLGTSWKRTSTLDIMGVLTELNERGMLKEVDKT